MDDSTTAPEATPTPPEGEGPEAQDLTSVDQLPPEVAKLQLAQARADAVRYRRKLRELEEQARKAEAAKEAEAQAQAAEQGRFRELYEKEKAEAEKLAAQLAQLQLDQMRKDAAQAAGIPTLWSRLQGSTPEELADDAKALVAAMHPPAPPAGARSPTPPTPPSQGQRGLSEDARRQQASRTF